MQRFQVDEGDLSENQDGPLVYWEDHEADLLALCLDPLRQASIIKEALWDKNERIRKYQQKIVDLGKEIDAWSRSYHEISMHTLQLEKPSK